MKSERRLQWRQVAVTLLIAVACTALPALAQSCRDRFEIDFGLARAGDAVKQAGGEFCFGDFGAKRVGCQLLILA